VTQDGLQVLNGLGREDVTKIKALDCQGPVDNLSRHLALDLGFAEANLEDGLQQLVALFTGEGCRHQRILHGLHDGVIETVPSVMLGNVLGANCIRPSHCLGEKKFELGMLVSIGSNHRAQEFPGFSDFQAGNGSGDSVGATGQCEVSRSVRLRTITPFSTFPFEVNQAPITFVMSQSSASGTKGSFPVVQHWLHLGEDIGTGGVVGGSSVEELGVVDKVQADQFD
jgi:hypothetical protein